MSITAIRELVESELEALDQMIYEQLSSDVPLITDICQHIIQSGGKRLRPLVILLAGRALGPINQNTLMLAVVIEFIHTATLLHDDVIDKSEQRRGKPTANALWGNSASVLVGDFLLSRAFELVGKIDDPRILSLVAEASNITATGEVMQLSYRNNADISKEDYLTMVEHKTASLFAAATEGAAILSGASDQAIREDLKAFGTQIGLAFQLIDDALDYCADSTKLGKDLGDDLAEGKPTLPFLYAFENTNDEAQEVLREALTTNDRSQIETVLTAIESTEAIGYTHDYADRFAEQAQASLAQLPDNPYRTALADLTRYIVKRDH